LLVCFVLALNGLILSIFAALLDVESTFAKGKHQHHLREVEKIRASWITPRPLKNEFLESEYSGNRTAKKCMTAVLLREIPWA